MHIDILSLFPGYFYGPFNESIIKKALDKGRLKINLVDIRDFADNKHRRVDDRPYGGGPGMVMMAKPVVDAIRSVRRPEAYVVHLSPRGKVLTAAKCRELALRKHLILLCGHYEGIDQRALDAEVDEEVSIGDFILTNGCLAAIVVVDGVARFVPDVLGHPLGAQEDSFENGLLEHSQYTRPEIFEGRAVPKVLLNGNHKEIEKWRQEDSHKKTCEVRPDLSANILENRS